MKDESPFDLNDSCSNIFDALLISSWGESFQHRWCRDRRCVTRIDPDAVFATTMDCVVNETTKQLFIRSIGWIRCTWQAGETVQQIVPITIMGTGNNSISLENIVRIGQLEIHHWNDPNEYDQTYPEYTRCEIVVLQVRWRLKQSNQITTKDVSHFNTILQNDCVAPKRPFTSVLELTRMTYMMWWKTLFSMLMPCVAVRWMAWFDDEWMEQDLMYERLMLPL